MTCAIANVLLGLLVSMHDDEALHAEASHASKGISHERGYKMNNYMADVMRRCQEAEALGIPANGRAAFGTRLPGKSLLSLYISPKR